MKTLSNAAAIVVALLGAGWLMQQGGSSTIAQHIITASGSLGPTAPVRNIGASAHWLQYCTSSQITSIQIALEGSNDAITWYQISDLGTSIGGCTVLSASGYYQNVRANVYALQGVGGSIDAWYTGTDSPIPPSGLTNIGLSAQKSILLPGAGYENVNLKSSPAQINAGAGVVYTVHVYNPNAGVVYVQLTDNATGVLLRAVPAGAATDWNLDAGVSFATSINVGCSTSDSAPVDPATGCITSIAYRPYASVASLVSANGTVQQSRANPNQ